MSMPACEARGSADPPRSPRVLAITPQGSLDPNAALMARIASGDRAAFDTLARRLHPTARRIAARVLGHGPDAEDAVQAALLNLWRKAGQFDVARGRVEPWFNRLVANACLDRRRTIRFVSPLDEAAGHASSDPGADDLIEAADERARVARAVAQLNPRQRAAIALFYGEESSTAEVAQALETTSKAVEGLLARARTELARILLEAETLQTLPTLDPHA